MTRTIVLLLMLGLGSVVPSPAATGATTRGWATWCAPTPRYCQSWGGDAMLGAVRSFRYGDRPYRVVVRAGGKAVTVTVVSFCACGARSGVATVIDLSPAAYRRLAPLATGRVRVTVERADTRAVPIGPPTDLEVAP